MGKYKYLLFDLDGTLTDPKEGICKSVQYALKKQNIDEPDIDKLTPFIGPPLIDSFKMFYDMDDEKASKAVADYRERFSALGLYENQLYPGMAKLLKTLKKDEYVLLVASSKPKVFVEKILEHFKIAEYFDIVVGSELDGSLSKKEQVVEEALIKLYEYINKNAMESDQEISLEDIKKTALMIGDRCFDIEGAVSNHIDSTGVLYGYGSIEEFVKSGATYVVDSVTDLKKMLYADEKALVSYMCTENKISEASEDSDAAAFTEAFAGAHADGKGVSRKPSFFRALHAIMPLVVYYVVSYCVISAGLYIITKGAISHISATQIESIHIPAIILIASNALTALILYFISKDRDYMPRKLSKNLPLTFVGGALTALALNLLIQYICQFLKLTDALNGASSYSSTTSFGIGIILFGLTSPLMEEIMFRWLMYGRIKAMIGKVLGTIVTSLFFGFYHGNIIQGIYAFIMGLLLIAVYEWCKSIMAPVFFHIGANVCIFSIAFLPKNVNEALSSPLSFAIVSVLAVVTMLTMFNHKELK